MAGPVDIQILLHEAGTEKAPQTMHGAFCMERRCWLEVLEPPWSTRYDAEGRILLSEAGLVIGEVPNCLYFMILQW